LERLYRKISIFQAKFSVVIPACFFRSPWYPRTTMSQDQLVILRNKESGEVYYTRKNKKKVEKKLEMKKYSKKLRKRITFKESKK